MDNCCINVITACVTKPNDQMMSILCNNLCFGRFLDIVKPCRDQDKANYFITETDKHILTRRWWEVNVVLFLTANNSFCTFVWQHMQIVSQIISNYKTRGSEHIPGETHTAHRALTVQI